MQSSTKEVVNPIYRSCPQGMSSTHNRLILTVDVLFQLQHLIFGVSVPSLDTLRKLHVDVQLDWSLQISHNKINLATSPTENDAKNDHESNCEPCHNRCVGLKIIHSVDLLSAVEVQSGLVRLDLVCCEVTLASH
jgi:hypothetical protein